MEIKKPNHDLQLSPLCNVCPSPSIFNVCEREYAPLYSEAFPPPRVPSYALQYVHYGVDVERQGTVDQILHLPPPVVQNGVENVVEPQVVRPLTGLPPGVEHENCPQHMNIQTVNSRVKHEFLPQTVINISSDNPTTTGIGETIHIDNSFLMNHQLVQELCIVLKWVQT